MPRTVSVHRQVSPARPARRRTARLTDALRVPLGGIPASGLPCVSLHLPTCNEPPANVQRTLDALSRLDYPDFEVLVIDSNTDDPALWEPVAEHCARLGPRFRFFQLGPWHGGKAGALNFGLGETTPDAALIGVLDSGTTVRPDWLRRMVPSFADTVVGFAWSPRSAPWVSPWVADAPPPANPDLPQPDALILLRRSAVEAAGGWAAWSLAEDVELGLRLLRGGWRGACRLESFGGERGPEGFVACSRRRFRQAYGTMQACRAHYATLLSPFDPALTLRQRAALLAGWLPELGDALGLSLLIAALAWSAGLILNPRQIGFPLPVVALVPVLLLAATVVRGLRCGPGRSGWRDCAGAALATLALSHAAGSGVWQALLGGTAMREDEPSGSSALVRRLAPVRGELALLLLAWSAMLGIAGLRGLGEPGAWAWCGMLLVQSSPCLAAAVLAAREEVAPAGKSRVPHGAIPR